MSVLFNHAIRHEWLEQGRNPILLVRQSAKRQRIPEWLEPEELRALLSQLDRCFRVMVFLDAGTGLRRSELFALKWADIEFESQQIVVQRSIYSNLLAIAKQKPRRNLCPWIQFSPPNFGPGNNKALTINPRIGCSRALVPRARTLIGRISFYLASSGLPQREPEFESVSGGTPSGAASPRS
jgi:integrase